MKNDKWQVLKDVLKDLIEMNEKNETYKFIGLNEKTTLKMILDIMENLEK